MGQEGKSDGRKSKGSAQATSSGSKLFEKEGTLRLEGRLKRQMEGRMVHKDNPHRRIIIDVDSYWETEDTVLEFLEQFLSGYVWALKLDSSFIAVHEEEGRVRRLLDRVRGYRAVRADPKRDVEAFYGDRFVSLALVELSMLIPSMWD